MSIFISLALSVATLAAAPGANAGSLPLRPGVYVDASSVCRGAPAAARTWFGGGFVIQAPHARCVLASVSYRRPDTYRVVKTCYENGDPKLTFRLIDRIKVISPTEYQLENRFGRFTSHWCHG